MKTVEGVVEVGGVAVDVNEVAAIESDGGSTSIVHTKGGGKIIVGATYAETCEALDFAEGGDDDDDGDGE